ncbi:MAG TPA: xanthine dehydrogenase family protein subunit M [Bryobacteraceae bacterium]|nr:xanthine dehydrogenase family protein subunit M [Bryobacteraceae bacterium]
MFDHVESFHRPRSIPEAIRLLHARGSRARLVAGGTDVVVGADQTIRTLVDITGLGLNYIRRDRGSWKIGATTTIAAIESSSALRGLADGILAKTAAGCGSVQIRNMATLGGNLANASPAADMAVPLLVLDTVVVLAGARGRRRIPLAEFFHGPGQTALGKELLVEVIIPAPPRGGHTGWSFQKLGRTESDISVVNAVAGVQLDAKRRCKWARIALGAVAPTPIRLSKAETLLADHALDLELIDRVCDEAAREVSPIDDVRASASYRREMSRVLVRRALLECAEHAGCTL